MRLPSVGAADHQRITSRITGGKVCARYDAAMEDGPLACGNCGAGLRRLVLDGHYGSAVEIDLCAPCHLLWFDTLESVRLTGVSLLALIGEMAQAQRLAHRPLGATACPRCARPLEPVSNRSRFGATVQLECPERHGMAQTFGMWLAEKGLWRELTGPDRAALQRLPGASHGLHCLNCGGALEGTARCRWCETPAGVIDLARLAGALDVEGATEADPLHRTPLARHARNCVACGAALPQGPALRCSHCDATLAVGDLREVHAALQALEPALRRHQQSPAPHVVRRRLDRQRADPDRHRQWVREMEAGTAPEHRIGHGDDRASALDTLRAWVDPDEPRPAVRWFAALLVLALLWWLWPG